MRLLGVLDTSKRAFFQRFWVDLRNETFEVCVSVSPFGNPAVSLFTLKTRGFASPPRGGFAFFQERPHSGKPLQGGHFTGMHLNYQ